MNLSRKWLNEFVDLSFDEYDDKRFAEAMTVSGSKVEVTENLSETIKNVKVGRILSIEKHPNSDHMLVTQIDIGEAEPVQICTGAWNVHCGDLVPAALHNSLLPGGVKITKGKLRGVESAGMLCSLKELDCDLHDFPYAEIKPAAILGDYHPIDPAKPSIPADIKAGDKIFGSVVAAKALDVQNKGYGLWQVALDLGEAAADPVTDCQNVHAGDLVAYDTKKNAILSLDDLRAKQEEFPHCISDGILILNEDCKPGDDMAVILGRDDHVVEFEITPNRPDCLCVIGLAREAAVTFGKELKLHEPVVEAKAGSNINDMAKIIVEDAALCPRYTARMVKNVKIAPSPRWMRERIRNAGMRPINNIVDITNYVMLEYGQPMHAFDFACVGNNEIHVRTAREGESIRTLDGTERKLTPSMLCICDTDKPVAVAGVMGGENSEIVGDTAMVLFESANFNGTSVRRTATALGMRTDASARFEKGLDPQGTLRAVNRGHDFACARRAVEMAAERGLHVGAHFILGLPGEGHEELMEQAGILSRLPLTTLKMHQLQLIRGTRMAHEYSQSPSDFHLYTADEYVELVIDYIERLRPDLILERFVSQSPKELLIAPDWGIKNHEFTERVKKRMRQRQTWQGRLYEEKQITL